MGECHGLIAHERFDIARAARSLCDRRNFERRRLGRAGPGGGMGTESHFTQTTMAVLVYGVVAIVVCAGVIGAVRRR